MNTRRARMKLVLTVCAVLMLATALVGQTSTAPKKTRKKATAAITAQDVQSLKDAIAAQQAALTQQQQQIQELRDQLRQKDQAVQQAQSAATDATSKADAAQTAATQQQQSVTELKNDLADIKTNNVNTATTMQEMQKSVREATESPAAIHYKGVFITPGGFIEAATVTRQRGIASGINTPFNS